MRDRLIKYDGAQTQEIISNFSNFFNKNTCKKYKILSIWESSYLLYSCNKSDISLIKLSYIDDDSQDSIEEQFQEYKLRKKLNFIVRTEKSDEHRLIEKFIEFEKIKAQDQIVCKKILNFWIHIITKKKDLAFLEEEVQSLKSSFQKLNSSYEKLLLKFQDSAMIIEIYSSFLISFYNDVEKATSLQNKKKSIEKYREANLLKTYQENNPLFIVSASHSNMGEILYVNSFMCNLLSETSLTIIGRSVSEYFPIHSSLFEKKNLKGFKSSAFDSTVYTSINYAIKNWKGFIIEVDVLVILVSFYKPFYLVICKPLSFLREIALISKDGIIHEHSEYLERLLEINFCLKDKKIQNLIDINIQKLLKAKEIQTIALKNRLLLISYNKLQVQNQSVRFIYFYTSENDFSNATILTENNNYPDKRVSFRMSKDWALKTTIFTTESKDNEKLLEERKFLDIASEYQSSSSSSHNLAINKINSLSTQSIRTIKILKLILFISVFFI